MAKSVFVDENTCIGCGLCAQLCPAVYAMQDNGKSKAVSSGDGEDCAQQALDSCPVHAITWQEGEGGEASSEGEEGEAEETPSEEGGEASSEE